MPDADALSILAEVAIGIAGFSGIVAVFGRRSSGHWSTAERVRLSGLLVQSFTALFFSVAPLILFSIPISEPTVWKSLSLLFTASRIQSLVAGIGVARRLLGLPAPDREVTLVLTWVMVAGDALVLAVLMVNALFWGVAWLYLSAICWSLAIAAILFARLVLLPVGRESAV